MRPLREFLTDRLQTVIRITVCLLSDGSVFCLWIMIAWGIDVLATYLQTKGVNVYCAIGFKWASSVSTLLLTIFYIARDIKMAVQDCFDSRDSGRDN